MSKEAELRELAQLTMLTGKISAVHYESMIRFPFIFYKGVREAAIDYEIATNKNDQSRFVYKLKISEEATNDLMDQRHLNMVSSTKFLFWRDVIVNIFINGEEVYKSE